ncbi:MAG: tetratricopeptide repeat protein [Siphonobacter sp.]
MERIEWLRTFCEEEPDDPFNWYALTLEYQKTDSQKARAGFEKLLTDFPNYVPTYYHAGQFWAEADEEEEARRIYQKGIDVAEKAHDTNALRELKGALQRWEDEWSL